MIYQFPRLVELWSEKSSRLAPIPLGMSIKDYRIGASPTTRFQIITHWRGISLSVSVLRRILPGQLRQLGVLWLFVHWRLQGYPFVVTQLIKRDGGCIGHTVIKIEGKAF